MEIPFVIACCLGVAMFLGHIYLSKRNKEYCPTCDQWTKSLYLAVIQGGGHAPYYAKIFCSECRDTYP